MAMVDDILKRREQLPDDIRSLHESIVETAELLQEEINEHKSGLQGCVMTFEESHTTLLTV